jgi:hypothetical protein
VRFHVKSKDAVANKKGQCFAVGVRDFFFGRLLQKKFKQLNTTDREVDIALKHSLIDDDIRIMEVEKQMIRSNVWNFCICRSILAKLRERV